MEQMKEMSMIIISYRLSTIQHVDTIYFLEQGQVLEQGSHEELMAYNGKYAEMYTVQAQQEFPVPQAGQRKEENYAVYSFQSQRHYDPTSEGNHYKGAGRSEKALAYIEVKVFGKISADAARSLTERICAIYETHLQIEKDCVYIKYEKVSKWGWNGSNFQCGFGGANSLWERNDKNLALGDVRFFFSYELFWQGFHVIIE